MMNKDLYKLTQEEIEAGVILEPADPQETNLIDISDRNIEKMARGFILGSQSFGKRRELKEKLEKKVTTRIGRKGKWISDKLFELIEGIYIEDRSSGKNGTVRYYKVPPSLSAIIYALDRVLGKPKQQIEATEEKRGIVLVEHVIRNLANNPYRNAGNEGRENDDELGEGLPQGIGEGALQE